MLSWATMGHIVCRLAALEVNAIDINTTNAPHKHQESASIIFNHAEIRTP
jgi:hypothetical protein